MAVEIKGATFARLTECCRLTARGARTGPNPLRARRPFALIVGLATLSGCVDVPWIPVSIPLGAPGDPISADHGQEPKRAAVRVSQRVNDLRAFLGLHSSLELAVAPDFVSAEVFEGSMTMRDAAELALENRTDVRIATAQTKGQSAIADAAIRSLGPQVSLGSSVTRELETTVRSPGDLQTDATVSLELVQPILRREAQTQAVLQLNDVETSGLSLENARSLAILDASNAYLSLLQSQLIIRFAEEHEARLESLRMIMEERVNAGGASPAELQRVLARIQGIRATISDVRAGLSANIAELVLLTGSRPQTVTLPETIEGFLPETVEGAFEVAKRSNWEIRTSRNLVESANLTVRTILAKREPTVDVALTREMERTWLNGGSFTRDTTVGLNMNWVLFRNGALDEELRSAAARVEEAEIRLEDAEKSLLRTLRETYVVQRAISEQYAAYAAQVESNEAVVDAFTEQIVSTNRPVLDVLEAYQGLFQSKVDLTNVVVTETQLNLRVLYLLGELSVDRLGSSTR
jgi:adhesin transport system outer membrane protein